MKYNSGDGQTRKGQAVKEPIIWNTINAHIGADDGARHGGGRRYNGVLCAPHLCMKKHIIKNSPSFDRAVLFLLRMTKYLNCARSLHASE